MVTRGVINDGFLDPQFSKRKKKHDSGRHVQNNRIARSPRNCCMTVETQRRVSADVHCASWVLHSISGSNVPVDKFCEFVIPQGHLP
eukprot:6467010-Amphidinium_carterae.1